MVDYSRVTASSLWQLIVYGVNVTPQVAIQVKRPQIIQLVAVVGFAPKYIHGVARDTSRVSGPWTGSLIVVTELDFGPNVRLQVVNDGFISAFPVLEPTEYDHGTISLIDHSSVLVAGLDNIASSLDRIPSERLHVQ